MSEVDGSSPLAFRICPEAGLPRDRPRRASPENSYQSSKAVTEASQDFPCWFEREPSQEKEDEEEGDWEDTQALRDQLARAQKNIAGRP
jgi:hypothetical protein